MTLTSKAMSAFAAVSVAAGLGLGSDFAEARDRDHLRFDHDRHHYHDRGHVTRPPQLNRGIDPRVLMAPRPYYYAPPPVILRPPVIAPHHHGHNHANIWPWVAGAALLGVYANAYSTPSYSETIIIQDSQLPAQRRSQPQVCFNNVCSYQTGSVEINGEVCQETQRGGVSYALCPGGQVFTPSR